MPRTPGALIDWIVLDRGAGEPLQRQLYRALRNGVLEGRLAAGQRLPATRRLAEDLGLGRVTILGAYDLLVADGLARARAGSGLFVEAGHAPVPPRRPAPARPVRLSRQTGATLEAIYEPETTEPGLFTPGVPAVDLFPLEEWTRMVGRTWRRGGRRLLVAGDARGHPRLRAAIAAHLGTLRGLAVEPEQIFILNSTRQAIDLIGRLVAEPGDRVWMEEPGFVGARTALIAAGLEPVAIPVDDEGLDVAAGVAAAPDARAAYLTPAHQYPTGATLSPSRRQAAIEWARGAGAWLIEDDYDGEFRHAGPPVPPMMAFDSDGRVIHVGTFAKSLFPSLRLAVIAAPTSLLNAMAALRLAADGHPPQAVQVALAEFLDSGRYASHLRRMRLAYAERRAALADALDRRLGGALRVLPSVSGLHLTGEFSGGVDDRALLTMLELRGMTPSALSNSCFGGAARSGLILGYGAWSPSLLALGVERLAEALEV